MKALESASQQGRIEFVVTMPPSPSRLEGVLAAMPAARLMATIDTTDAFRHLACQARHRLVVMTPYLDAEGVAWASDMFASTGAAERILVVQSLEQLDKSWIDYEPLRQSATRICVYASRERDETFHSKIVLADGSHAYVGSANLLSRSKSANLECGLMVEGAIVSSIATLVEAILLTIEEQGADPADLHES